MMSGLGARSRESLPKPGQSTCNASLVPAVANRCRIFNIINVLRRGGTDRMASASGVRGRCSTTLGKVCVARSLSRMGWSYSRQSGIAVVTKRECSLTGMARSAFSRSIAFVLEGREWYSGASSYRSKGPSKVSTIHGGGGPGRAVRCHSKLSAALRS